MGQACGQCTAAERSCRLPPAEACPSVGKCLPVCAFDPAAAAAAAAAPCAPAACTGTAPCPAAPCTCAGANP
eukprot:1159613-Pelagomonas_calceolata.AAC.5